jgi:Mor family transcriptional regulator
MSKKPKNESVVNIVKRKLAGKEGAVSEILGDVKKVAPEQWNNRSQVERLTKKYINKLGLSVPDQRVKQFVDAYMNATRNGASVDELIKKYGKKVDKNTANEIKKYIPKM